MLEGEKDGSFFLKKRRPPRSTLFPDTTLFRYNVDRLERRAERAHDLAQQVVGHRPGRAHALLLEGDRRRLDRADPDGEVPLALRLLEQQDRLVPGQLDSDADDSEFLHGGTP